MPFASEQFRAMGTEIEVLASPALPDGLAEDVRALFESVESRLSRFRDDSELSLLNRSSGEPFRASPLLREVLFAALESARTSGARFDPTVLEAVEASGYRRSFDEIEGTSSKQPLTRRPDYRCVTVRKDGTVVLRDGVRIDLGGFAKGWTVDAAAPIMAGCESWVVNAGGDLLTSGPGPEGDGWLVGIEDPWRLGQDLAVIRVRDSAVATSSVGRRRWLTQDGWAHHLIDPRTGEPAATGLSSVTVLAPTVARAEVLTKTVLLMGARDGLRHMQSLDDCAAALVSDDGTVTWTRGMEELRAA